jgi:predicted  nucleic acid-binding Zn-ribbon protein
VTEPDRPLELALRLADAASCAAELVHALHALHARQWTLEDLTRRADTSIGQIASAKQDIDASNSRRHRLIDQIDGHVLQAASAQRLYSETVGELIDRLLILELKQHALRERKDMAAVDESTDLNRHLAELVNELVADLAAGRAKLPPRFGVKVYRQQRDVGAAA